MSPELEVGLIVAAGTALLTWGVFITVSVMRLNKETKDNTDIKKEFEKMEERVHADLKAFDLRLLVFLQTEIQELKSILRDDRLDSGGQRTSK